MQSTGQFIFNPEETVQRRQKSKMPPVKGMDPQDPILKDFSNQEIEEITHEAKKEALKEEIKNQSAGEKKLDDLIEDSGEVILKVKTFSLFNLFPTVITINTEKLTVIRNEFFWSQDLHTFPIRDIKEASVTTSIIFAKMTLVIESFHEGPLEISYLFKSDALKARRVIMGLKICKDEEVDLSEYPKDQLLKKAEELGRAEEGQP